MVPIRKDSVEADRELILEDAHSISYGLWRMAHFAQDAAESLGARIEDEDLNGMSEAVEVREPLERLQTDALVHDLGRQVADPTAHKVQYRPALRQELTVELGNSRYGPLIYVGD
jgi:hypothetical protein